MHKTRTEKQKGQQKKDNKNNIFPYAIGRMLFLLSFLGLVELFVLVILLVLAIRLVLVIRLAFAILLAFAIRFILFVVRQPL